MEELKLKHLLAETAKDADDPIVSADKKVRLLAGQVRDNLEEVVHWGNLLAKEVGALREEVASLKLLVKAGEVASPDVQVALTHTSEQLAALTERVAALEAP